jgi:tetratricopeptide (TPR) repeat protein
MTVIQYCYSALDHLPRAQLTRARIHYTIGLIHRQQHEYREAKRFFTEAMIDASKALEDYADANKHLITAFTIAKCVGLGLAWVFYTEAALHIAEPFLITARTLLRSTPETIIRSYVDVVHGCVQRAAHGNNPILLQRAVDLLTEAYTLFKDRGHSEYQAKAANELALAHLQQAMNSAVNSDTFHKALAEAGNKADEVTRLSLDRDPRATCNALILSSRINRLDKNWPRAKQLADQALKQSQDKDARFNRIDALIAVGEAALELREYAAATKSFIQALDEGSSNPKIRAICHLHLSDAYIRQGAVKEAKAQFQQWRLVADIIENAFIHSFGRQIEATLTEVRRDFFISFSEMQLNPSELEDRLHGFIARWAKDKEEDDAEAAKRIKRSRATLYNWLNAERQWTDRGPAKESADAE